MKLRGIRPWAILPHRLGLLGIRGALAFAFVFAFAFGAGGSIGCVSGLPAEPVEQGRAIFSRPGWSAPASPFACASCHPFTAVASVGDGGIDATARVLPGLPLAGATQRPTFWGGQELTLPAAIEDCRLHFMGSATPLAPASPEVEALLAFISSLQPADSRAQSFTLVPAPKEVGLGDPARGAVVYQRACQTCHGTPFDGKGKLDLAWPTLPQEVFSVHGNETPATIRLIFIEKIRHGGFLGYTGRMPPFAREVMDDASIADILSMLALTLD